MTHRRPVAFLLLLLASSAAPAAPDDDFLAAREAYRNGRRAAVAAAVPRLADHVLGSYVAYWNAHLALAGGDDSLVKPFLAAHPDSYLAERLRADWLRALGKRGDWGQFRAEMDKPASEDLELSCYGLSARIAAGESGWEDRALAVWPSGRDLPESCTPVFDALREAGRLDEEAVWARIRNAFELGNSNVAVHISERFLPAKAGLDRRLTDRVAEVPTRYLAKLPDLKSRPARELALYALLRVARNAPDDAWAQLKRLAPKLPAADRAWAAGQIAYQAARRHLPEALAWYQEAGPGLSPELAAWRVRAALRAGDWKEVLAAVEALPAPLPEEAGWRYWRARALLALGRRADAGPILAALSSQHNFYGQLALEELGETLSVPQQAARAGAEQMAAVEKEAGFRRALALYRLGLRLEGIREWNHTLRNRDDPFLLAAAELARRNGWHDRSISTADRTGALHDFSLRFPLPYREVFEPALKENGLDTAWVYGLVRQESRFIADARSSAGAQGLMQLMPATARWVAKRMGLGRVNASDVVEPETNVALGAYYLRHVLDTLDGQPLLASAAYNAGPMRAERWRGATRPLEGAVYAETIPFNETRDYVKKVMSNAGYYAGLLGEGVRSVKARLGQVAPRERREANQD